ncbi:hypothetical protein Xinn_04146 [Xenorhabdus innexi]|uniref:Secreted protein n=1 Tax=Xenorhabdus innexi TaxID=290109 RepID=A0A2G0MJ42_9GAMM|nr:hypothetical protein Xinn_04146 [Xenorhabdus innexi]
MSFSKPLLPLISVARFVAIIISMSQGCAACGYTFSLSQHAPISGVSDQPTRPNQSVYWWVSRRAITSRAASGTVSHCIRPRPDCRYRLSMRLILSVFSDTLCCNNSSHCSKARCCAVGAAVPRTNAGYGVYVCGLVGFSIPAQPARNRRRLCSTAWR